MAVGVLDEDDAALNKMSKGGKRKVEKRKGVPRSVAEVEADLADAVRYRELGKIRGEGRQTVYMDGTRIDLLLSERHYLSGE